MSTIVPRYLVAFHPKRVSHHFVDVLVIGGGIAGLRATMAIDPRLSTLVVSKDQLQESNSAYAQGGIMYVYSYWSNQDGYKTPSEWNSFGAVGNDTFL